MNPRKVDEYDYIQFLLAAQRVFSAVEASKVVSGEEDAPAYDAYTRLLQRNPPDCQALWREVETLVMKAKCLLVIDDTTLDKPYADKMAMVTSHWSGKHHAVVSGINPVSLLWTDGQAHLPCDFRFYNPDEDRLTKNDHFQVMLKVAQERGLIPELVAFDRLYSGLENLKLVRSFGWDWLTQFKKNRLLSIDRSGNRPISERLIPSQGQKKHLKGYGWVKVFKTVAIGSTFEYWATSSIDMTLEEYDFYALDAWQIEVYHRGQFRLLVAPKNHIGQAIRAFARLKA